MKKVLSSLALAGMAVSGVQAADFNVFGHAGVFYDQGLSNGNVDGDKKVGYVGFTGHVGGDVGFDAFHLGVGAYSGIPIFGNRSIAYGNEARAMYSTKYIDLSDLYLKYDSDSLKVAAGRFNNEFLESDWLTSYIQGIAAKYYARTFGIWGAWMNDYTTYGYAPGRIASELSAWSRFPSSFNHFQIDRNLLAAGFDLDFDFIKINPFIHYFLNYNYNQSKNDLIQVGTKIALVFGDEKSVQSTTSFRFLWQNQIHVSNDNTMLFWGDEELLFIGMIKLGGGYYATTGGSGIYAVNNVTRFYGLNYFTPHTYDLTQSYFSAHRSVWYVFTGLKSQWVDLDILYADGNYNEFSAIASVNVFDKKVKGSLNGISLKVGGGYVANGFGRAYQKNNIVAFVKLGF